jgi:hypothetical protein
MGMWFVRRRSCGSAKHHGSLPFFLVLAIVPLLVFGFSSYKILRRIDVDPFPSLVISFVASIFLEFFGYLFLIDCDTSFFMDKHLKETLSSSEFSSLKRQSLICPTEFTFIRDNGKEEFVFGQPDFIHGPKMRFGRG